MKNRKRTETTITVGSEPTVACAAMNNAGESAERWALHQSPYRRESHHCGIFALSPAARGLRHALRLVLFVVAASLIAPSALLSQAAAPLPALLFAGAQITVGTGLDAPYGVAVDAKGDVFIADSGNNRALKLSAIGGAQTTIGNGVSSPYGVAVDGAGNVFIAETDNNRVVEIAANGGAQTTVGTGLNSPHGVAVDGVGNVFIADTANSRVVKVLAGSGIQTTVASGLGAPTGVAVDGAGDVYIAGRLQLVEVKASGAQIAIGSGLNGPEGVALDGAGNVFISDVNNGRVVEVLAGSGTQITLAGNLNQPHGLAVDGTGNVFIADTFNNRILELEHSAINLGSTNVCPAGKTTPAPCSQTVALTYNVIAGGTMLAANVLTQGVPNLDFAAASNTCQGQLTTGASCTVTVKFTPQAPGPRMGAVQVLSGSGTTQAVLASTPIYGQGEGPAIAFGPRTLTTVGSGFDLPAGVAVDAKGDVFVADSLNNRVVEVPVGGGAQTTIGSGLSLPSGVAVDGAGDVFIADTYNNRVVEVPAGGGAQTTVGSGFNEPYGLAVDGAGDVFIADARNGRVVKVAAGTGIQTTVASGFSHPLSVAVDGAGNVFVLDSYNDIVVEVPASGGAQITVASQLALPEGMTVDAAGDVIIADSYNQRVEEFPAGGGAQFTLYNAQVNTVGLAVDAQGNLFVADINGIVEVHRAAAPTLSFTSGVGKTSLSQRVTVQNIGNQTLSAVSPGVTISTNFKQLAGPGTPPDCTTNFSLAAGASCNLSIGFTPLTTGSFKGTAVLTDNAQNAAAATQTISLSGTGQALLTPVVQITGGPFVYNGLAQPASCMATGTGGVSVSGSCSFTYNGSANAPVNGGTYSVTASFTSTNPYYGNATGTGKLTIAGAPLTITANNAIYLQGGVFPTLTVSYAGFVDGQTQTVLTGTLKITTTATTSSAVGNYPITPSGQSSTNYVITFVNGNLIVQPPLGLTGTYMIQNVNSGLVLGVGGASTSQGANIVQWTSNGSPDQRWTITPGYNGDYMIRDVNSGLVIGVPGASTNSGVTLVQWQSNGGPDQEWRFTPSGSNWIITDANSGLELDIQGGSTSAGAQALQWTPDGSPSQVWKLVPAQ
jgi:sugar lactone lactonase YvrE